MRTQTVALTGQLTVVQLDRELARVVITSAADPVGLVVDCRTMTGYDGAARERFVAWNREHREKVRAIAVVTENRVWWMVVSTMSLAASQRMRAFDEVDQAIAWLAALP